MVYCAPPSPGDRVRKYLLLIVLSAPDGALVVQCAQASDPQAMDATRQPVMAGLA